ncbi:MAG: DUF4198 domain-containing protein [Deltaproteobacteria bacterium]|jgi:uncharacterized GH25 family protein|nr:DUF4198 domain-containing protein [Deltaproteobacteria bacterium]
MRTIKSLNLLKILAIFTTLTILSFSTLVFAHDHWIGTTPISNGEKVTAIRGFGHNFPDGEAIPEGRDSVFTPITILAADGSTSSVTPSGENNFTFISEKTLNNGTYLLYSEYSPTFWSETPTGRQEKPKNETEGATSCRKVAMYAKSILNVGDQYNDDPATKTLNQLLEFVPPQNPSSVKVGEVIPIKLLYDGKPLARTLVTGTVEGMPKGTHAFSGRTDKDGIINFMPLKTGRWILTANTKETFEDKSICDEASYTASLFFTIDQ